MSVVNFNTKSQSYRNLIGNGVVYRVPSFQRDYSWGDPEWSDLWEDIVAITKEENSAHYMGFLVLQTKDDKEFEVIDGQQRLATLSILILAALKYMQTLIKRGEDQDNNIKREEELRRTYIGYLDPVTLITRLKLTLNRNNHKYYDTYLVPPDRNHKIEKLKHSEKSMSKAFDYFYSSIEEKFNNTKDTGRLIADFIQKMSERLIFTTINVSDELNAYIVFETLNARGVKLSSTDLLKNYLLSILYSEGQHEAELEQFETRWNDIIDRLKDSKFTDFLFTQWNSCHKQVRKLDLFKNVKKEVKNKQKAFELLRQLEDDLPIYLSLVKPEESELFLPQSKEYASVLGLFNIRQSHALLMAARRVLPELDFEKLLRSIVVISFRYNVVSGFHTSVQEKIYYDQTHKITLGESTTLHSILQGLKQLYVNDESFELNFKTLSFKNTNQAKYVLCEIEKQKEGVDQIYTNPDVSLEHIYPKNPTQNWVGFSEDDIDFVNRLGNMTLLNKQKNNKLGNKAFLEKKKIYADSPYKIAQEIADHDEWTKNHIIARQKNLGKYAKSIWSIPQFQSKGSS